MTEPGIDDMRVRAFELLPEPRRMRAECPLSVEAARTVCQGRGSMSDAIHGRDPRMIVILGPCSIHDSEAALEYAARLHGLIKRVSAELLVIMRVYLEKPRTTGGWKGLINDPKLDGTHDIELGLRMARKILLRINEMGVPCATEFLDPMVPQFTSDLVSWAVIGARTSASQIHRELASGLSMPVGFKNSIDGVTQAAIDAMVFARSAHDFLGVGTDGKVGVVRTTGNPDVHIVLRGGASGPNFSLADLAACWATLGHFGGRRLMVDCGHGNSNKDYRRQCEVFRHVVSCMTSQQPGMLGAMLESNLMEGRQKLGAAELTYGMSITDPCIGWEETEALLVEASERLRPRT